MVILNKIYTRTGDDGTTGLGSGERRPKYDLRVSAYGTVDEANAAIGLARTQLRSWHPEVDAILMRVQNDLFDLGADLATPDTGEKLSYEPLRIVAAQVKRVESEIDGLNKGLETLRSFVLPGGTSAAATVPGCRPAAAPLARAKAFSSTSAPRATAPSARAKDVFPNWRAERER